MLNDRDRRILDEIERHLAADDPRSASISRRMHRSENRVRRGTGAALVVAGLSAVLCFALATRTTVGAGAVATVLFAVLSVTYIRRAPLSRTRAGTLLRRVWSRVRAPRGRAASQ